MSCENNKTGIIYALIDNKGFCYIGKTTTDDIKIIISRHKSYINKRLKRRRLYNFDTIGEHKSSIMDLDFECEIVEKNVDNEKITRRKNYWYDNYKQKGSFKMIYNKE